MPPEDDMSSRRTSSMAAHNPRSAREDGVDISVDSWYNHSPSNHQSHRYHNNRLTDPSQNPHHRSSQQQQRQQQHQHQHQQHDSERILTTSENKVTRSTSPFDEKIVLLCLGENTINNDSNDNSTRGGDTKGLDTHRWLPEEHQGSVIDSIESWRPHAPHSTQPGIKVIT